MPVVKRGEKRLSKGEYGSMVGLPLRKRKLSASGGGVHVAKEKYGTNG